MKTIKTRQFQTKVAEGFKAPKPKARKPDEMPPLASGTVPVPHQMAPQVGSNRPAGPAAPRPSAPGIKPPGVPVPTPYTPGVNPTQSAPTPPQTSSPSGQALNNLLNMAKTVNIQEIGQNPADQTAAINAANVLEQLVQSLRQAVAPPQGNLV